MSSFRRWKWLCAAATFVSVVSTGCRSETQPRAANCEALSTGCQSTQPGVFVVHPPTTLPELVVVSGTTEWVDRLRHKLEGIPFMLAPAHGPGGEALASLVDAWVTDAWVFGHVGTQRAVVEMPGELGLAQWGSTAFSAPHGWLRFAPAAPRAGVARRCDSGGNLLVSPPVGKAHPDGCLVVGSCMQEPLKRFFAEQRLQACAAGGLFELDTSWLRVGHLDEVLAFTGGPGATVLADAMGGWKLLSTVPWDRLLFYARGSREYAGSVSGAGAHFLEDSSAALPQGAWAYVRIVAGTGQGQVAAVAQVSPNRLAVARVWDLRASPLRAVAACRSGRCDTMPIWFDVPDTTSRYVIVEGSQMWLDAAGDPFPAIVSAGELRDDPSSLTAALAVSRKLRGADGMEGAVERAFRSFGGVRPAALFAADDEGRQAWAFVPSPANLIPNGRRVLLLAPFGPRRSPPDDESDVFATSWKAAFAAAGLELALVDGWDVHRGGGGARCAANVLR